LIEQALSSLNQDTSNIATKPKFQQSKKELQSIQRFEKSLTDDLEKEVLEHQIGFQDSCK